MCLDVRHILTFILTRIGKQGEAKLHRQDVGTESLQNTSGCRLTISNFALEKLR